MNNNVKELINYVLERTSIFSSSLCLPYEGCLITTLINQNSMSCKGCIFTTFYGCAMAKLGKVLK